MKNKKILLITILPLLIILLAATFLYIHYRHKSAAASAQNVAAAKAASQAQSPQNNINYGAPTDSEKAAQDKAKSQIVENNTPAPVTFSVSIVRVTQPAAGQPVSLRTLINGATTGTCTVTYHKSGQASIVRSYPIGFEATYSSCETTDLPANTFTADGAWSVDVSANSDGRASNTATSNITIER